jgi:hypothetical protein
MAEETYGSDRAKRLVAMLRALAARIVELERDQDVLAAGPELLKRIGDVRSELFHYEVRSTYDTPEVAENRRIVDDAQQQLDDLDFNTEDDAPWRDSKD